MKLDEIKIDSEYAIGKRGRYSGRWRGLVVSKEKVAGRWRSDPHVTMLQVQRLDEDTGKPWEKDGRTTHVRANLVIRLWSEEAELLARQRKDDRARERAYEDRRKRWTALRAKLAEMGFKPRVYSDELGLDGIDDLERLIALAVVGQRTVDDTADELRTARTGEAAGSRAGKVVTSDPGKDRAEKLDELLE